LQRRVVPKTSSSTDTHKHSSQYLTTAPVGKVIMLVFLILKIPHLYYVKHRRIYLNVWQLHNVDSRC